MKKSTQQYEQLYINLKKDYDSLLEKNQNDLIKIRIKEKTLNEKIQQIQRQRQEEVQALNLQVQSLKRQLRKGIKVVDNNSKIETSSSEISSIKQKLLLKEKQFRQLQIKLKEQQKFNSKLKKEIKQMEKSSKQNEKIQQMQFENSKIQLINQQNDKLREELRMAQVQLSQKNQQCEQMIAKMEQTHKQQMLSNLNMMKQMKQLIGSLKAQLLMPCQKCLQFQQQLQLHKQMLKSVTMMLRFKQMELQNAKK